MGTIILSSLEKFVEYFFLCFRGKKSEQIFCCLRGKKMDHKVIIFKKFFFKETFRNQFSLRNIFSSFFAGVDLSLKVVRSVDRARLRFKWQLCCKEINNRLAASERTSNSKNLILSAGKEKTDLQVKLSVAWRVLVDNVSLT
jgi:hypothetical protein